MEPSVVEELRLGAFKSFRDARLPLEDLTLVVGRNGSGKSNALDGLWVLARLAHGEDIRDALDGGAGGPAVRGGAAGSAPFGSNEFELGCTVRTGTDRVGLDVTVQIEPHVQIVEERLVRNGTVLLESTPPDPHSGDLTATWADDEPGRAPELVFRAGRLLTSQIPTRVPNTTAGTRVHAAAAQVLSALSAVFVLDPVPHLMRQYVPRRDTRLRRNAENLSAAVASLLESPATAQLIRSALHDLNEQNVIEVGTSSSSLGDVMLTVTERMAAGDFEVPARVMSDGTLRFMAVLASLLQAPTHDVVPDAVGVDGALGQTTVVIEELESGLHASQASDLIGLVRDQVKSRRVRALATAHSPAVLNALTGDEHERVVVCQRDREGRSRLTRLVDLDDYWRIAASGGLGRAAEQDGLRDRTDRVLDPVAALDRILGTERGS